MNPKKISIVLILAGAFFALLSIAGCGNESGTSATNGAADTGGKLQLSETYFDAGSIPVGTKVEHKFTIKNTGTGPLKMGQMAVKRLEGC